MSDYKSEQSLKSKFRHSRSQGLPGLILKVRTPWATGGLVILAIFTGFLINILQPNLMIDYQQPNEASGRLNISSPTPIEKPDIKEVTLAPDVSSTAPQNAQGSYAQSKQACTPSSQQNDTNNKDSGKLRRFINNIWSGDQNSTSTESSQNENCKR